MPRPNITFKDQSLADLQKLPQKIETRSDYVRGEGYVVTVKTTYTRTRRIRALSPEDAATYAVAREATFAPRYFETQQATEYSLVSISVPSVEKAPEDDQ